MNTNDATLKKHNVKLPLLLPSSYVLFPEKNSLGNLRKLVLKDGNLSLFSSGYDFSHLFGVQQFYLSPSP